MTNLWSVHHENSPLPRALLTRPTLVSAITRGLTAPGVGRSIAGAWSIAWNDLVDGATPGAAAAAATTATGLGYLLTARSADRRWIGEHLGRVGRR